MTRVAGSPRRSIALSLARRLAQISFRSSWGRSLSPRGRGLGVKQGFQTACRLPAERSSLASEDAPCKGEGPSYMAGSRERPFLAGRICACHHGDKTFSRCVCFFGLGCAKFG